MSTEECKPRKHDYEFLGNKTFTQTSAGPTGTKVRMSVNAVYKCRTCAKVRRGPGNHNAPWPQLI